MGGSSGSEAARFLASKKVNAIITGRCRPSAYQTLSDLGIYLYLKQYGTAKEVLEKYKKGQLRRATGPNLKSREPAD